jgi:hypothetical protein
MGGEGTRVRVCSYAAYVCEGRISCDVGGNARCCAVTDLELGPRGGALVRWVVDRMCGYTTESLTS